ncbi:unnamed protein product [Effrenium voratum]|nr:unnamed protein product [Effrenium voratum]
MLLGIATKLMATSGRRRDAHARELDMLAEDSEKPGDAEVQTPMRPMVSFKNYAVDLAHTPASPTSGATQALREALGRSPVDVEELSMALEQGRRSNVDTMLLSRGEDVFMSLIEKQAAVTRLATAIQNRMLKETCGLRCRRRSLPSSLKNIRTPRASVCCSARGR